MGEVVDLEIYRKRLKRKAARGQGPGNRRSPDRGPQCPKQPGARESRSSNASQLEPSGKPKVESSDSKSD